MEEYINNSSNYNFSSTSWSNHGDAKEGQNWNNATSSPILNSCLRFGIGNMGLQYGTGVPTLGSIDLSYPKQLQMADDISTDVGYNGSAMQNLTTLPQFWPSGTVSSSISAAMGQDTMQQRQFSDETDFLGKRYVCMDQILQLNKLPETVTSEDKKDLQSYPVSSLLAVPNTTVASNGVPSLSQTASAAPAGDSNGTGKTRVRARRGHATDPHSIAERLRREKIAERMKNLQELVPNSSKIDKASMLDEIIEYVKFLQLQVKVLSMSRLGAAGAVIPLITDGQTEGSKSLSLSPSASMGAEVSSTPDQIAFEQEVLRLLESNVTAAIQYLQSKGLCLMPIALANAISNGKPSDIPSQEKKKYNFTNQSSPESNGSKSTIANGNGIMEQGKAKINYGREFKPDKLH